MSRPGIYESLGVAIAFSLAIGLLFSVMSSFFPTRWLLQAIITMASFSYVIYLLVRSEERTGRLVITVSWLILAGLIWLLSPSTLIMLFVHLGLIWLIRVLYYHSSIIIALVDMLLVALAVLFSLWTLNHTHSLFLSAWVFFMMQAVFALLPKDPGRLLSGRSSKVTVTDRQERFERAYESAQSAVRELSHH